MTLADTCLPAVDPQRHDPDLRVALDAVDAAVAAIRPWFRTRLDADTKADDSPVTRADREAEEAMRRIITTACPDDGVLGEEAGLRNSQATRRWVIDPIDGTRAFITGRPSFGILLALLEDGVPVMGILQQPMTGERWIGRRGYRTWFAGGLGGAIGTRPCADLGAAELSATSPAMFGAAEAAQFKRLERDCRRTYWGGDCYAYGLLALGMIDIVAECDMKIWDWAALVPIIAGAGGAMTDWHGAPLTAASDGSVLAVGDVSLQGAAIRALARPGATP